jgi:hypothetical protein
MSPIRQFVSISFLIANQWLSLTFVKKFPAKVIIFLQTGIFQAYKLRINWVNCPYKSVSNNRLNSILTVVACKI